MNIPLRPLGKVREIVQSVGLDISYAYDDLVFSDHSVFILKFNDDRENELHLYFNADCNPSEANELEGKLTAAAKTGSLMVKREGFFKIFQKEEAEELQIEFIKQIDEVV